MSNWAKLQEDLMGKPVFKRAKHSIHFQNNDDSITANFSGKPCHYEDGGIWKPIDTKLVLLPDGFYGCPHSPVRVHSDGRVKVEGTDYLQRTELPSAKTGLADNDKLVREFSFGKQELRITEDGFKSEITLNRIPTLTEARKLIATESGRLSKAYLKSLTTATDANGDEHTFTTLTAFRTWLASATFPVVIDPDFAGDAADGRIYGSSNTYATARATSNTGKTTETTINPGNTRYSNQFYPCRCYFKFVTSSIGENVIAQVNLKFVCTADNSTNDFDVQIAKYNWASYENFASNATSRETAYDEALVADLDDAIWRNTSGISTDTQYTSGNLSTAWVNTSGATYYAVLNSLDRAGTEPTGSGDVFVEIWLASANHATEGYRPVLTVTYTAAGGFHPINMNAQMQSLTGGMRG